MAARRATLGGCSKRGGDFYLAIRGDTDLATRGELITATECATRRHYNRVEMKGLHHRPVAAGK